jgi:signal transduction histidine kinase
LNLKTELLQSGVVAPIVIRGKTVGVIFLGSTQPSFYQQAHARRLEAFTNQAAIAITNAWLARDLTEQKQELRLLSTRLIDTLETERRRIARELHDAMSQSFTAIEINLATVLTDLPPDLREQFEGRLSESRELADTAVKRVRELILGLRPIMLDDLGLIPTVRWHIQRFSERTKIEVTPDLEEKEGRLPPAYETALYRTVQETLTNVARHAEASHVLVSLHWGDTRAELFIEDNGKGFDPKRVTRSDDNSYSMGLLGIQERVAALNGTFELTSEPGEGTTTHIVIPLDADHQPPAQTDSSGRL